MKIYLLFCFISHEVPDSPRNIALHKLPLYLVDFTIGYSETFPRDLLSTQSLHATHQVSLRLEEYRNSDTPTYSYKGQLSFHILFKTIILFA